MPGTPLPKRPQTSRQAKRAYQKSRAVSGPSKTDLKRLERAAVLQERANRIKKREAQKAANRQKRMEKEQKEREARKRMGIPEPKKMYISPRQERLSQFVRGGRKGKEQEEDEEDTLGEEAEDTLGEEAEESEGSIQSLENLLLDQSCLLERGSPVGLLRLRKSDRQQSQHEQSPYASPLKPASTQLDDLAAFFVSNTQIQRELTDDESDTADEEMESLPGSIGPVTAGDVTADFLGFIATQDLEFDIEEKEETIPIEETLPMFLSQDGETSGDEQMGLDHEIKDTHRDSAQDEDLTSFFLTQDLDFSEDELDEWEPSQGFRARSQATMMKLGELRCQLGELKEAQPPPACDTTAMDDKGQNNITARAEGPSVTFKTDEEDFAFSSQDLLALENAAANQDVTDGRSPSDAFTEYNTDDFAEESLDEYVNRMISGERELDKDRYLDLLAANHYEDENDYDYGGL